MADIKRTYETKHSLVYDSVGVNLLKQPLIGDIVLVITNDITKSTQKGKVVNVGKSTVGVRFANKHVNHYNPAKVIFLYRALLGMSA